MIKQDQFLWEIPVCYDASFGIDLEEIANKKKCSVTDIIRLHTETDYIVSVSYTHLTLPTSDLV